jgi:hypothetical protein
MDTTVGASLCSVSCCVRVFLGAEDFRQRCTCDPEDFVVTSRRPVATWSDLENVAYLPRGLDRPVLVDLNVAALVLLCGGVDEIHDDPYAEQQEP